MTIRILNASTDAVISEMTTATPTSSTYINTGSPLSLGDVTVAFKIQMYAPTGKGIRLRNYSVTGTPAGGQQLTPSDLALVDTPVELEFDLYDNANAQTVSYTTSSTGAVTVSQSNYITATVNANNTITVTPVAVTNGPQTITVNQAADNTYAAGSVTFTVDIEDSTPTTGSDVTFDATEDKDLNNTAQGEGSIVKNGVTFTCSDGILGNGTEYRLYKNSTTTFSVESGTITQIVFTCPSGNPASGFGTQTGWTTNGSNGTWTGSATSVSFVASSKQVRATTIVVTVETSGTPDPTISADNMNIAYSATSGSITYSISNEPSPAGTLTAAVTDGNWLTLGQGTTSPIAFTCTANENTTARTATVTLTYTYGDNETVSTNVTVTQAAAPVIYNDIEDLFNAATSTATDVNVEFGSWFVTGVSTNGKSVFVTDGTNGFVIFDNGGGLGDTYHVDDLIDGTTTASLVLYTGFAELKDVDATNLTMTSYEAPAFADVAMANLSGINTGALVHYENLTCSVDNNKYYLSDGTTTLQVYNALYAFNALEDGEIYNITGVYQQFNSTKEILPRSANDIVKVVIVEPSITVDPDEVSVDAEEHDGTLDLTYENLTITEMGDFDIQYYDAVGTETSEPDWIEVLVAEQDLEIGEGYVVSYYMVKNEGTEARTAYFKVYAMDDETNLVYSNLVTVTQAAPVVPPTPGNWVLTSLADLTEDDIFVIVGDNGDTYAMSNDNGTSNPPAAVEVTVIDGTLSEEPAANLQWNLGITNNGYIFYPNGDDTKWLYNTASNAKCLVGTNTDKTYVLDSDNGYLKHVGTGKYIGIYNSQDWRGYSPLHNNIAGQTFAFYKKVVEPATESYTLTINGYTDVAEGEGTNNKGYYLIASPVNVDPATAGMTTGDYDLYYFDQEQEDEWRNYEAGSFNLVPGTGYLYAKKAANGNPTYSFELTGIPYNNAPITLSKSESGDFAGHNLVGNPFGVDAYITKSFYTLENSDEYTPHTAGTAIHAMQGLFVVADEDGETLTFSTEAPVGKVAKLNMNVSKGRNTIDQAIVSFNEGQQLPKLQFRNGSTKVYIPKEGKDYAIVSAESGMGEMPVNFKAENNGTYTLSFTSEEVSFSYLHLVDNMTGADIDLLTTPSYSFEARTTDYANRFKLSFKANTGVEENATSTFAYYNGSAWNISNMGEATLQVIDMMGRVLSSETISGNVSISLNQPAGVYMLRLVNGENVMVQKVVVR